MRMSLSTVQPLGSSNEQLNDNKTSRRILWRFNIDGASLEQRKQEDWQKIQARFSRS